MSNFISAAATSQKLSLTAMEEASRYGLRTADIEHMLIALTINEQIAGQVLRGLGITLDATRNAVSKEHSDQLSSLGIQAAGQDQGAIVFHETGGYDWSERALEVITRASKGTKRGDAAAVLRELVVEPSGTIEALLSRLASTPGAVIAKLDEVEAYPGTAASPNFEAEGLAGASKVFVSAERSEVFELLRDPSRMPDWEPMTAKVEDPPSPLRPGSTWVTRSRTTRPDGKAIKVKPEFVLQQIELLKLEEGQTIEWRITFPDAPRANAKRLRIELEPAAAGTQLRLSLSWEVTPERRRVPILRGILRPLFRFALWMQLNQLGAGISRAFR